MLQNSRMKLPLADDVQLKSGLSEFFCVETVWYFFKKRLKTPVFAEKFPQLKKSEKTFYFF